jgi:SAM-dependent methyltransferase
MANDNEGTRQGIVKRFSEVAESPGTKQKFPIGPERAESLGYDGGEIDALPSTVTESFCGVGNPLKLGRVSPGETVLDLGSGAGMDSILAASQTGSTGRVIGIDMTAAMIDKAQRNAEIAGVNHVEFRQGTLEALPVEDNRFDVAITNGVFNLCLDKPTVLREVYRVLRPGGRFQMADILLHDDVSPGEVAKMGDWSD